MANHGVIRRLRNGATRIHEVEDLEAEEECLSSTFEKNGCADGFIESTMEVGEWCRRGQSKQRGPTTEDYTSRRQTPCESWVEPPNQAFKWVNFCNTFTWLVIAISTNHCPFHSYSFVLWCAYLFFQYCTCLTKPLTGRTLQWLIKIVLTLFDHLKEVFTQLHTRIQS